MRWPSCDSATLFGRRVTPAVARRRRSTERRRCMTFWVYLTDAPCDEEIGAVLLFTVFEPPLPNYIGGLNRAFGGVIDK